MQRRLARVRSTPPATPGFSGPGHTAVEVLAPNALRESDPFVLLMDDRLDMPTARQIGGAHPHAGLETVTLILEGTLEDRDEGSLSAGDVIWMTAGRGIIHNESVVAGGRVRILQLWIRLPSRDRRLDPSFEVIHRDAAPFLERDGVKVRLYSGASAGLRSPTSNRVPTTLVDLELEAGASYVQSLPASYNGFVYVLDGELHVGDVHAKRGDVGWLDRPSATGPRDVTDTSLTLVGGPRGARVVLYAGEVQNEPLVQHGPFVAGSPAEIREHFLHFQLGEFESMGAIARAMRDAH